MCREEDATRLADAVGLRRCGGRSVETRAAEQGELSKLENGTWFALGAIVEQKAEGCACSSCTGWHELDSLWGIVIEPDGEKLDEFARHSLDLEPK